LSELQFRETHFNDKAALIPRPYQREGITERLLDQVKGMCRQMKKTFCKLTGR
jgi:hypothetical protein